METHLPILIPLVFLSFALIIPLTALFREEGSQPAAALGASLAAGLSIYSLFLVGSSQPISYGLAGWRPPIGIEFFLDPLSAFILAVINSIAALVIIHSRGIYSSEFPNKQMPFYSVAMLLMLGLNGMVLTGDLFTLFVFLEISSLASYALIGIGKRQAPFAALRYLLIGTAGGSMYLLGVGYLYHVTGTLNMLDIKAILPGIASTPPVVTGLILMTVGIGIKAAVFPMHGWLPDSYSYASSTSSALIAPIGTKVALYILARILLFVFGVENINRVIPLTTILALLAAAGIIYGSIMAIGQNDMKRMLAYSSVAQVGYIVLGFALGTALGFIGAILHILNHAIMKASLFMVAGHLQLKEGHTDISRLDRSYSGKYPYTMVEFTLGAISMIGLPPLAGFFSKWYLALGSIQTGGYLFLAVLLISSLLNAVYFFRILEKVYIRNPDSVDDGPKPVFREVRPSMILPALILGISLLVIGLGNVWAVDYIAGFVPEGLAGR